MQPHVAGIALDHELVVGEGEVADATGYRIHGICEVTSRLDRTVLRGTVVGALWDHGCAVEGEAALAAS